MMDVPFGEWINMCGICGIVSRSVAGVDLQRILQMRDTMIHRGPDGAGYYTDEGAQVGLGHRRLSIIDLSEAASQPMTNENGSVWLVLNGEIYNYLELVPLLEGHGHRFRSHSDTEVIIHAYEEWGIECLAHFNGMFAFALWDKTRRLLFCARDRLGIKPFYYHFEEHEFTFASELKAIVNASPACRRPCYEAIYDFLTLMRFDHNEGTFLADVKQLRGGHYLLLDLDRWAYPTPTSYWSLSPVLSAETLDYSHPVETFRDLLFDAVRLQLRSDVPVGTFLSGGLDSSSLVAIISRLVSQPMRSFSVAYNESAYNEQEYMDAVIEAYPVIPKRTFPSSGKLQSDLARFVWAQDTPPAGPGPFSEWCVAESAKGNVTVLLNGQGPDEILGGYPFCFPSYMHSLLRRVMSGAEKRGWSGLIEDARVLSSLYSAGIRTSSIYYLASAAAPNRQLEPILNLGKRKTRGRWFHPDLARIASRVPLGDTPSPAGVSAFDATLHSWTVSSPLPELLHYADRNSMAFSLEARVPYLDHRLVEYAAGLPMRSKLSPPFTKQILRQALAGDLIEEVRQRRTKLGFSTPIGDWFRERPELLLDVLTDSALRNRRLVQPDPVRRMINRHLDGSRDSSWDLWRLLVLELWFQGMIDGRPMSL